MPLTVAPPLLAFEDDDSGYVAWTRANTRGYVVNTYKRPAAAYLILHWADCRDISGRWDAWTSRDYAKVCGTDVAQLEAWARDEVGGVLAKCAHCWA